MSFTEAHLELGRQTGRMCSARRIEHHAYPALRIVDKAWGPPHNRHRSQPRRILCIVGQNPP
jgi:hypothetical protein